MYLSFVIKQLLTRCFSVLFLGVLAEQLDTACDIGKEALNDGFSATEVGERDTLVGQVSLVLQAQSQFQFPTNITCHERRTVLCPRGRWSA
jgi:hypothetical protein